MARTSCNQPRWLHVFIAMHIGRGGGVRGCQKFQGGPKGGGGRPFSSERVEGEIVKNGTFATFLTGFFTCGAKKTLTNGFF
jgi:hypothetical protein